MGNIDTFSAFLQMPRVVLRKFFQRYHPDTNVLSVSVAMQNHRRHHIFRRVLKPDKPEGAFKREIFDFFHTFE